VTYGIRRRHFRETVGRRARNAEKITRRKQTGGGP
jgi:hypothetical protein